MRPRPAPSARRLLLTVPRRSMPRAPWPILRVAAACLTAALVLTACDEVPGDTDPFAAPPTLSDFQFTPLEFALDTEAETAQIPIAMDVFVSNPAGGPVEVRYFVRAEFGSETLLEGALASAGGGRFTGDATLAVPRGETGFYVITVTAANPEGRVGNTVSGLLRFTAQSLGPPVIEAVDFPATVTIPPEGGDPVPVPIVATVTDPDGPRNINRVEIQTLVEGVPTGPTFQLRDDGGFDSNSGDEAANDGRYTITFQVESTNSPGDNVFRIRAIDRAGEVSDPVDITITIE